ncbi:MAG: efflux RND transporter periplasmic adaptor subunit [Pseudomonadota bacterium]
MSSGNENDTTPVAIRSGSHARQRTTLIAVLISVALVTAFTGLLNLRVSVAEDGASRPPMPVAAQRFIRQPGYNRPISFIGLVRAGRVSNLGFEVPGTLAELSVREGSAVAQGDLLAQLDTAQLQARRDAAAADRGRVEAELELARIKEQRQRNLQATGAVSEEASDETRLRAKALSAQLASVEARLRGLDIDLQKSRLTAPYSGVVAERLVNSGAVVNAGTPVLRLVASDRREAHIGIAAEQTALLRPGERYTLTLRSANFEAVLRSIRPDVDPLTLTATAVFELPEHVQGLEGEPVDLIATERVQMTGAWVPLSALIEGERGLWTVMELVERDGEQVAQRQVVEILDVQGSRAYVDGSLANAALFVADGVHRIAPGTPLKPMLEEVSEPAVAVSSTMGSVMSDQSTDQGAP